MLTIRFEALNLSSGAKVLDLGCGEGRHVHHLTMRDDIVSIGLDLNPDDVFKARDAWADMFDRAINLTVGDAMRLPFADNEFDAVICSEVLEHLPDWHGAMSEIARIAKPGARIALSVPRYWPEAICWRLSEGYRNTPGGHVRIFRKKQLTNAATERGWRHTGSHHAHALHAPYWWLQCAFWNSRGENNLVAAYRRFLEWDILKQPRLTRALDRLLNPVMGKSLALYFETPA